jgi:hypothetical protein
VFIDQIAAAIDGARGGVALDTLSKAIWQGLTAGALGDDDAQRLAEIIHAKREAEKSAAAACDGRSGTLPLYPPRKPQRPPLRPVAIERRRRLASSGPLPPSIASRFTTGELAVLRIVADEHRDRGVCLLCLDAIAARAGVCRSLAKKAMRLAESLGLVSIMERRRPGQKNLPNVVKVIDREWLQWMAKGPRSERPSSPKGIGVKKLAPTDTRVSLKGKSGIPPRLSEPNQGSLSTSEQGKGIRLSRGSREGSAG